MEIKITQEHIDAGIRERSAHCPMALALGVIAKSLHLEVYHVDYKSVRLYSSSRKCAMDYALPPELQKFVEDVDARKEMKPFTCEIDLTKPLRTLKADERGNWKEVKPEEGGSPSEDNHN